MIQGRTDKLTALQELAAKLELTPAEICYMGDDDIDVAAARAVALGATQPAQPDPRWRVLLDPAGHPFCLTPFTPDLTV